jgi:hypothetical protein
MSKRKFFLLTLIASESYYGRVINDPYFLHLLEKRSSGLTPLEQGLVNEAQYALRHIKTQILSSDTVSPHAKIRINSRCMSTILWIVYGDILNSSKAGYRSNCHNWGLQG